MLRASLCRATAHSHSALQAGSGFTYPVAHSLAPRNAGAKAAQDHAMPADPIIRPLTAADNADWRRLWTGYLAYYETTVREEVYTSTFARLLGSDPRDFNGLIATVDGQPLGLAHYLCHRHAWKIEEVCYLQDLYVAPQARGTGLGRKLMEAVYTAADAAGAPSVYWLTQDFNYTARQLYDRVGKLTPFIRYTRA
jgi:GNAT superfamily N-acetyltransferase